MESSFSFRYPQHGLGWFSQQPLMLTFPANSRLWCPVPAPKSSSYRLSSILISAPFLALSTPKLQYPNPFQYPHILFPLCPANPHFPPPRTPSSAHTAPPYVVQTTCPSGAGTMSFPRPSLRVPEKVWFPHGDCGATAPHPHPRSFLPTQDATAWSRLPSTVFPQVLSSLPAFLSRQASPRPAQGPRMQASRPLSPC